ncbi:hypothetical protein M529_14435 [Sphingobium ummariense RL-3]|uniref:Uncharacterized protein n=1 Tax=Sphingobium ummariense RL-3 TaxID=1346791 RepID=T0J3S5_9SPHN|nr:hypothetical protein M529_14435 [Sphingobium ummariense RL-3]
MKFRADFQGRLQSDCPYERVGGTNCVGRWNIDALPSKLLFEAFQCIITSNTRNGVNEADTVTVVARHEGSPLGSLV